MGTELDWFRPEKVSPETRCPPPVPIADDLVGDWLAGMKPTTQRGYSADADDFARWLAGQGLAVDGPGALKHLTGLAAGDAHRIALGYKNDQLSRGLSSATIGRRLAALRSFVRLSQRLGRVNWELKIRGPAPEPRRDVKGPDAEGMKRVRTQLGKAAAAGPAGKRDRALVSLLYGLGLRRAEAAGLTLDDVDFKTNRVRVLGKGKREKTEVPMSAAVARDVGAWVLQRGTEPGPLFHAIGNTGARKPLNLGTVNRIVGRLGKAAGLAKTLRPHGFRHAAITTLARRKKTVPEMMSFSRHANVQTLMGYLDELSDSAGAMVDELGKDL